MLYGSNIIIYVMYLLLCLFAFFDLLALRNRDVPVQLEIPETVDEEARRIAYNIAHNKAFINLDLRGYHGSELVPKIQVRFQEEYSKIVALRERTNRPVVPFEKVKKSRNK